MSKLKVDRDHYRFNIHTLKYEKIVKGWKYYLGRISGILGVGAIFGIGFFFIYAAFLQSPDERALSEENSKLKSQYKLLSVQLDNALEVMQNIEERDENFYRVILEADSLPKSLRTGNYDLTARYKKWDDMKAGSIVKETTKKMDVLNRMIYVQSASFDELVTLAKQSDDRLNHIPAIMPVMNKDLKRTASGYGRRIDPIYQTLRFHCGMDFSAPVGTEIYATGAGVITYIGWRQGYGNCIVIDHGYDYKTLYGHISKFKKGIFRGSKVNRGDVIAFVGNTGKSTGPHLHYEVHFNNHPQNPQNYYYLDLSPEQYDEMIRLSASNGKMFD